MEGLFYIALATAVLGTVAVVLEKVLNYIDEKDVRRNMRKEMPKPTPIKVYQIIRPKNDFEPLPPCNDFYERGLRFFK